MLLGAAITVHERQAEGSGSAVLTLAFAEAARVHERTQWPRWNAENGAVAKQPPPSPRTDMGHMGRKREKQQTQVWTPVGVEDMPSPMTDPMAQLTRTGGAEKRQKAPGLEPAEGEWRGGEGQWHVCSVPRALFHFPEAPARCTGHAATLAIPGASSPSTSPRPPRGAPAGIAWRSRPGTQ